jgi:hypothetical protein
MIFMHVILKVLMVAALKITAIREVMPCSLLDVYCVFQRNLLPLSSRYTNSHSHIFWTIWHHPKYYEYLIQQLLLTANM